MIDETLTVPCEGIGVWEGARVVYRPVPGYDDSQHEPGESGVVTVVRDRHGHAWVYVALAQQVERHPPACLDLDLTHGPTRVWAIERWRRATPRAPLDISEPWLGRMHRPDVRYLACGRLHAVARPVGRPSYLTHAVVVPALADLDPTDGARLPDGARVVDVQALARVLRHVFSTKVESQCRT